MASSLLLSAGKKEFRLPKPVHLPRLTLLTSQRTSDVCSQEKKALSAKKINLRPLKEVLRATDYELLFGSSALKSDHSQATINNTFNPSKQQTVLKKSAKSKLHRPVSIANPTRNNKRLQTNNGDKKIKKPKINFIEANKCIKKNIKETPKIVVRKSSVSSSNSKDSDRDFRVYEKLCKSYKPSPLTKLCESLEISKLENTIDSEMDNYPEIIFKIKQLVNKEEKRHRKFVANITNLVEKLERSLVNKENDANMSNKNKEITTTSCYSPLRDLRQDIFHKNIAKKLEYNESVDSTKIQKAFEMYSTLKEDCKFLCTPKPDFKKTPISTRRKVLSTRIQEQCLLLVETPKH